MSPDAKNYDAIPTMENNDVSEANRSPRRPMVLGLLVLAAASVMALAGYHVMSLKRQLAHHDRLLTRLMALEGAFTKTSSADVPLLGLGRHGDSCEVDDDCDSGNCKDKRYAFCEGTGIASGDIGSSCQADSECDSGLCLYNTCYETNVPYGGSCYDDRMCASSMKCSHPYYACGVHY